MPEDEELVIDWKLPVERPVKPTLSKKELRLLRHYQRLAAESIANGGDGTFYRSLIRTAKEQRASVSTIQRYNYHLRGLGHIDWVPGHGSKGTRGCANFYRTMTSGL